LTDRSRIKHLGPEVEREIKEAVRVDLRQRREEGETLLGRQAGTIRARDVKGKGKAREVDIDSIRDTTSNNRLRILVVGDRLATDVLLSRRLSKHLASTSATTCQIKFPGSASPEDLPPTISIITTELFKRRDVRLLRWLEKTWSRIGYRPSAVERGTRAGWETFLLKRSLELKDAEEGPTGLRVQDGPTSSRLVRMIALIRGIPGGIRRLRNWRPPTARQIVSHAQHAFVRNVRSATPVGIRGLRSGLGAVGDRARGLVLARRNRTYSTSANLHRFRAQRRGFGTMGGMRLNIKHDLPMEPYKAPKSVLTQLGTDRMYERFPDDVDYSQFSASLDRMPIKPPGSFGLDHLETLGDNEIVSVLDEVLKVRAENPHLEHWDMGLISIMLSIRSRGSYDKILREISPSSMASLITSLLSMGAIHLGQLVMHDIAIRPRIADDVKIAVLRACTSGQAAIMGLDKSYLSRLVATVTDENLGLSTSDRTGETALVPHNGEDHLAGLQSILEGYLQEQGPAKTSSARIYKTLYTYTAEVVGLGLGDTVSAREREREAKWLVYRVIVSLLERDEVVPALKICKLLGQARWFDLSVFANRQTGGQYFAESTSLLIWCGVVRGCTDLLWIERAWSLASGAKKLGSKLAGTDNVALGVWSETINQLARTSLASRDPAQLEPLKALLLGPPLQQSGLVLSRSVLDSFYTALEESSIATVWSVYRRLRTQGYQPPRDTCLLRLYDYLARTSRTGRTQLSVETLVKDVQASSETLSPQYMPWFITYLSRSRSKESARRFYENAFQHGSEAMRTAVLQNPYVMYGLVRAFGGQRTVTNARSYDRGFAHSVIRAFIAASPPVTDLTPTTVGLLARSFVLVQAPSSAEKLFQHTFPAGTVATTAGTTVASKGTASEASRDAFIAVLVKGYAEALPAFVQYVMRYGISLTRTQMNILTTSIGTSKSGLPKKEIKQLAQTWRTYRDEIASGSS
jgi:hypothetical protein